MARHALTNIRTKPHADIERYERRDGVFRPIVAWGLFVGIALMSGCGGGGSTGEADGMKSKGLDAADQSVRTSRADMSKPGAASGAGAAGNRPVALLGNDVISWQELAGPLYEAAGGAVLEEVCLDRLTQREMDLRGLALGSGAVEREQELLAQTLALSAGVAPSQQGELIQQLRRSRGLGDARFANLLRRNAMLRLMVQKDDVLAASTAVSAEDVKQAHEIRYGERFQTRLILVRTEKEAADASTEVNASPGRFSEVAARVSIDPSAFRGGLVGAISPADPSYPLALRKAVAGTPVGTPSGVIALERGYGIVLVEQVLPPTNTDLASVSSALEQEVRLIRERTAMDRLAGQLLRAARISVLDPTLDWSWKARENSR